MQRSVITGTGSYLPRKSLTNDELARMVDTSDEWIVQRTGIRSRHIAGDDETTTSLGRIACERAMAAAGVGPDDIDLVLCATSTPDFTFPASAVTIQAGLCIERGMAMDVQAVCSGFVYAVSTADAYLRTGLAKRALVVGAETFSRILDWEDRATCVLFGDGAGAVVMELRETDDANSAGVLACRLRADGRHRDKLFVDGGPSTTKTVGHLRMKGREVFRHAVGMISDVIEAVFEDSGYDGASIDWFVPHQASKRIIDASARKLKIDADKIIMTVDRHGNTSAASIPLALDEAVRDGRIMPGQVVLLEAMGGGFTWGAVLLRM